MQKFMRGQVWFRNETGLTKTCPGVQAGSRPCVIVSNNVGNRCSPVVIVVPCTSKAKPKMPTHMKFMIGGTETTALCEQITTVAKSELDTYIGTLEEHEVVALDSCLQQSLNLLSVAVPKTYDKSITTANSAVRSASSLRGVLSACNNTVKTYAKNGRIFRSLAEKAEICKAVEQAQNRIELRRIAIQYNFKSVKLLKQAAGRWKVRI